MMIFVAVEKTGRAGRGGGEGEGGREDGEREKKRRKRDEAGRASSLGPEKLSEIMSEEIGSLARG